MTFCPATAPMWLSFRKTKKGSPKGTLSKAKSSLSFAHRLAGITAALHHLRELTDVVEIIADLHMGIINVPARVFFYGLPCGILHADRTAILNPKQHVVTAVDKSDALRCLLEVNVQPLLNIAVP